MTKSSKIIASVLSGIGVLIPIGNLASQGADTFKPFGFEATGEQFAVAIAVVTVLGNIVFHLVGRKSNAVETVEETVEAYAHIQDGNEDEQLDTINESEPETCSFRPEALEALVAITAARLRGDLEDPFPRSTAPACGVHLYTADDEPRTQIGLGPALKLTPGPRYGDLRDAVEGNEKTEPQQEIPSSIPPAPAEVDPSNAPTLRDRALMDVMAEFLTREHVAYPGTAQADQAEKLGQVVDIGARPSSGATSAVA
jgi:hypothetical protein